MARISEKALRPRQYVFTRLTPDRIAQLTPAVRKLKDQERRNALSSRAAIQAAERHVAAKHAENIMAGITTSQPENRHIAALEQELSELRQRRRRMCERLRKALAQSNSSSPFPLTAPSSLPASSLRANSSNPNLIPSDSDPSAPFRASANGRAAINQLNGSAALTLTSASSATTTHRRSHTNRTTTPDTR